tara:strand:- start:773 stop:997 length:225 start_codon:yes stop_codon:yes gene_type:complete
MEIKKNKVMKRDRQFIEWTIVWKDKRRKKSKRFLELKELRLLNQIFNESEHDCIEIRVKDHFGTREEFDKINFG